MKIIDDYDEKGVLIMILIGNLSAYDAFLSSHSLSSDEGFEAICETWPSIRNVTRSVPHIRS